MRNPCKSEIALFNLLKDGETHTVEKTLEKVGCGKASLAVYVCNLRNLYGANISTIRDKKKAVAYLLTNFEESELIEKFNLSKFKKSTAPVVTEKAVDVKSVSSTGLAVGAPIPYGDREVADIMDSLGISGH